MASIDKQGSARRNAQPPSRHAAGHTLPTHNLAFGRLAVGFAGFAALIVQPAPLCIGPALSQHNHLSNTQHSFSCAAGTDHAHRGEFDLCAHAVGVFVVPCRSPVQEPSPPLMSSCLLGAPLSSLAARHMRHQQTHAQEVPGGCMSWDTGFCRSMSNLHAS